MCAMRYGLKPCESRACSQTHFEAHKAYAGLHTCRPVTAREAGMDVVTYPFVRACLARRCHPMLNHRAKQTKPFGLPFYVA
jgi:hypothetical protein